MKSMILYVLWGVQWAVVGLGGGGGGVGGWGGYMGWLVLGVRKRNG